MEAKTEFIILEKIEHSTSCQFKENYQGEAKPSNSKFQIIATCYISNTPFPHSPMFPRVCDLIVKKRYVSIVKGDAISLETS